MTVNIKIDHAVKKFGEDTVIPDLNLKINEGELFTLLGPSGCGKTTLLRMIAGFNSIEGGTIRFNDKVINDISPHRRNIGMVFQNYAIFPHMTSGQNIAFGLKNKKIKEPQLSDKVNDILNVMQIGHLKDRMPSNMSGGQQQRLALSRALVMQPDVLLMDEPLSNLDAKLRIDMRTTIREIQQKFKITTVYVTHDQEEALAISDQIAVMKEGTIQQKGTPVEVYNRPANIYVATFIGQSILFDVKVTSDQGEKGVTFANGYQFKVNELKDGVTDGQDVQILVRPNEFEFSEETGIEGKVLESFFLGTNIQYKIKLNSERIIEVLDNDLYKEIISNGTKVTLKINSPVQNVFDKDTEKSLMIGVHSND